MHVAAASRQGVEEEGGVRSVASSPGQGNRVEERDREAIAIAKHKLQLCPGPVVRLLRMAGDPARTRAFPAQVS